MPGDDRASSEPTAVNIAHAEQAILSALATYPDGHPPTPRALQQAVAEGRLPELTSIAFCTSSRTASSSSTSAAGSS